MAVKFGTTVEQLILDGVGQILVLADRVQVQRMDSMLAEAHADPKFQQSVERGIAEAERGEFFSEEDMDVRFEQMLASLPRRLAGHPKQPQI
jgi:hypothetical protein